MELVLPPELVRDSTVDGDDAWRSTSGDVVPRGFVQYAARDAWDVRCGAARVDDIEYDGKGRREKVVHGNGTPKIEGFAA